MITLSKIGNAIRFTFADSQHYLTGDGTIDVPVNSLSLIFDESTFATFKKAASNDIFVSAPLDEFGMTKAELITFYTTNMVGSTGGGGGGGVTSGEVQTMIDNSISGKADESYVETALADKVDVSELEEVELAVAQSINVLAQSVSGKQDTLVAGSGITISGNVISADGGGGVTSGEVQTMINNSISGKVSDISLTNLNNKCEALVQTKGSVTNYPICFSRINGESFAVFNTAQAKNFELVETSAITTSLTSSSTDSQVPSAKAVYDTLGGLKLVKCTQAEYDALVTKDPDTLYIITNVVNNS